MRLAIIGSGIAGLTAAFRLHGHHDVTIFEAGSRPGGHTHTVDVTLSDGERQAIDTGFIVFNHAHYPQFTALLDELGVASQPTDMSFSVRSERSGVEYGSASLNTLFAQRRNLVRPAFAGMLRDILRFQREAAATLPGDAITVAEYVAHHRYGPRFVDEYLVPLGASLWSSPPGRFLTFPMRFVIEFLRNHALLQVGGQPTWRVIQGGSRTYVDALLRRFTGTLRVNQPIGRIRRLADRIEVIDAAGHPASFDHAIVACHADQALALLEDASQAERDLLGAFPYQRNEVVLHTDSRVLPRSRRAWASWNYVIPGDERDAVSVTYDMNRLQRIRSRHRFLVTLNDFGHVDPARALARFVYHHPIFQPGRDRAQRRHAELIGTNRTSFCGAYWGFGFHEDGVRSALAVVDRLEQRRAA